MKLDEPQSFSCKSIISAPFSDKYSTDQELGLLDISFSFEMKSRNSFIHGFAVSVRQLLRHWGNAYSLLKNA
jgi:hypothetical protein